MVTKIWSCHSDAGVFTIQKMDNQFVLKLDGKHLDTYNSPEDAADALASGTAKPILLPSGEVVHDAFTLGVPSTLGGWACVTQHR